jgi:hypothetical protein
LAAWLPTAEVHATGIEGFSGLVESPELVTGWLERRT